MDAVLDPTDHDGLVDAEYESLFAELNRLCLALGAGGASEDIAQEAILEGRRKIGQLREPASLRPWLRRIAVRRVIRSARSSRTSTIYDEPMLLPADAELGMDAAAAIARLPDRQRAAVVLVYGLGYPQEEAATMLGISRGGVAANLWQARQKLARDLAPYRRSPEP